MSQTDFLTKLAPISLRNYTGFLLLPAYPGNEARQNLAHKDIPKMLALE